MKFIYVKPEGLTTDNLFAAFNKSYNYWMKNVIGVKFCKEAEFKKRN